MRPDGLGETTAAGVLRGAMWSVVGRILPQLQILGLSIVAANYLGPDGLGRQSYIAFTALSLVLLATAGLPAALNRFVAELLGARDAGAALTLFKWSCRVLLAGALAAGAALVLVAALGAEPGWAWVLAGAGSALAVLQAAPSALLVGAQRWREAMTPGLVTGVFSVPASAVALAAGGGITGLFAVEAALTAVNLVWTWALARRLIAAFPPAAPIAPDIRRRFLSVSVMATLMVAIEFVVWRRSEFFVLERTSTDAQIALYSIAFALTWGLARIPGAVSAVTMPAVATLVGAGELDRVRAGYWRVARLLLLVTPPLAAVAAAAGPELVRLAYGDEFADAGDSLLILLVPLPLVPLLITSGALLFAFGRVRFLVLVGVAATVVNVALALALIPPFDAVGAATANAISQLCAGVPALVLACRLLGPVDLGWLGVVRGLVAALIAGLATAAVVEFAGGVAGVCGGLALGIALWVGAVLVLRPLRAADAGWLESALGPRVGSLVRRASA